MTAIKDVDGELHIPLKLASLFVDVGCGECGKLMALPNAFYNNGKYLCGNCAPSLEELLNRLFILKKEERP